MKTFVVRLSLMSDGDRTVAEASHFENFPPGAALITTGKGSAGREPGDKSDAQVGEWLAQARALRSVAAHLERQAKGRMAHTEEIKRHRAEVAQRNRLKELAKAPVLKTDIYGRPQEPGPYGNFSSYHGNLKLNDLEGK